VVVGVVSHFQNEAIQSSWIDEEGLVNCDVVGAVLTEIRTGMYEGSCVAHQGLDEWCKEWIVFILLDHCRYRAPFDWWKLQHLMIFVIDVLPNTRVSLLDESLA